MAVASLSADAEPPHHHDDNNSSGEKIDFERAIDADLHVLGHEGKKEGSHATATSPETSLDKDGNASGDEIIITGTDAANHLLPLRDDFDPALTLRSVVLASLLAAFQSAVNQIYQFKPTAVTVSGTFIVLIGYFLGKAWVAVLPRGDKQLAKWQASQPGGGGKKKPPLWIRFLLFVNPGPWGLKEHAICSITATSASNGASSVTVFAAQNLFYDLPLSAATVILSTLSIGLFGYGLCGILRPAAVWNVDAVYWSTLSTVKTLQGLHWQEVKKSRPLRYFWYAYATMFVYEWLPAYVWPWLNSVSIPCLAAMHVSRSSSSSSSIGSRLTNLFGGASNNEGLGLFSLSFDWQYITSATVTLPLNLQVHQALGIASCFVIMAALYYGNAWDARSQPFMSTQLRAQDGSVYPTDDVFVGGVLDRAKLAEYGVPRLATSFAYSMFMANAAIGALTGHCLFFWGGETVRSFSDSARGVYADRHHAHMAKHYREAAWWWYVLVLAVSFVLGIVVVAKENITLQVWAYVVALVVGCFFAPLSTILYSRYGNGIATNNLSKMIAGFLTPGRPVGNMYFAAWSHSVISNTVNLSNDLKMGEYLKIPPRVMFLTQIYGTVLGAFVNYGVMISVVRNNKDLLRDTKGDSGWSGATIQSYNTNAASWALAEYLYKIGKPYEIVPLGLAIGFGLVGLHRSFVHFIPRIRKFDLREINLPQYIQYAGYIPYNQSQTCVIFSWILAGMYVQFYLRNYKPRIFKNYMYLVTGAWDGAALTVNFILSFAVFGAGGKSVPMKSWWGNNVDGYYDLCPYPED